MQHALAWPLHWLVVGFIVLLILILKKIPTTTILLVFSIGMKISISVSFFHQNWEDTEGRKKLTKINARVSVFSTTYTFSLKIKILTSLSFLCSGF